MQIVIFGGGMQGRVIASNLAARKEVDDVVIADIRKPEGRLPLGVRFLETDALDAASVKHALENADAAVTALPGAIGKRGLANVLAAGVPTVDISFTAETLSDLEDDALRSGACAIVDCGVAPGLSHILAGAAHEALGGLDELVIRVGGMPQQPPPVFHHAVYFNPNDLLSEYFRPARLRVGGKDQAPHPLDAPVESHHDEKGDFEAFPSDGLRSLLTSYPDVPDMVELTLRWPGHLAFMRELRETGFFDTHPLADGTEPPVDATARVLGARYPEARHPDFLLMAVEGCKGDERRAWRLLDKTHAGVSAMSRTTAYTAAAVAMLLATKRFTTPGLHAPERLGHETGLADAVIADLQARGVDVRED